MNIEKHRKTFKKKEKLIITCSLQQREAQKDTKQNITHYFCITTHLPYCWSVTIT